MKTRIRRIARFGASGLLALGAAAITADNVSAQSVFFKGYTNGTFAPAWPTASNTFQSDAVAGLTYENSTFDVTTVNGEAGVGAVANASGTRDHDNFGAFYLDATPYTYTGNIFRLLISFIEPVSNSELFVAALYGTVVESGVGGITKIDFDNTIQWFGSSQTYGVLVNDLSITSPDAGLSQVAVTGAVFATPEPVSMTLLGSGLLGLGALRRRRRKSENAELAV